MATKTGYYEINGYTVEILRTVTRSRTNNYGWYINSRDILDNESGFASPSAALKAVTEYLNEL